MEHLGDLIEKFKENNLPKASFLKLLAKAKPSRIFWLACNLTQNAFEFLPTEM